jgi:hypothetical protein
MSEHSQHKKLKRLQQIAKQRRGQQSQEMVDQQARGRDLEQEREEELREAALTSARAAERTSVGKKPVWSERMQMIRDKNTGRERMAKERWNRFAGTEGGGGRGL